ncbi:MAG: hypothetical protein E7264_00895 [Lachnospiraceae bacterium]|nr:hypothetical protein [Lachnospiraceae bacterium]
MTITIIIMIIIGIIICITSFFVTEKISSKEENLHNLMSIDDDYAFSERELRIIRRKIEDVIANQAKDILYETNESLANMANEKTMALGDYAVAVCEQIEKNHKEVMFLYSMLDDKQKDIMKTVRIVNDANKEAKDALEQARKLEVERPYTYMPSDQMNLEYSRMEQALQETAQETVQASNIENVQVDIEQTETIDESTVIEEKPLETEALEEETIEVNLDSVDDVFSQLDDTELDFDKEFEEEFKENGNSNDIILQMHRNGNSILEIAKQLGLGVGEVKLVIDLYQGE